MVYIDVNPYDKRLSFISQEVFRLRETVYGSLAQIREGLGGSDRCSLTVKRSCVEIRAGERLSKKQPLMTGDGDEARRERSSLRIVWGMHGIQVQVFVDGGWIDPSILKDVYTTYTSGKKYSFNYRTFMRDLGLNRDSDVGEIVEATQAFCGITGVSYSHFSPSSNKNTHSQLHKLSA